MSERSVPERVDLCVVGAGTAGAAAAGRAATRGMRVLCVDRGPLDHAGARWRNGVSGEAFDEAAVPWPIGPERCGDAGRFHLVAGWGPERVLVEGHGVLEVDMRRLVERLQVRAAEAGATLVGDVVVEGVDGDRVTTSAGIVRAGAVVDASGLAGARLLRPPPTPRRDLCAAAQAVYDVGDRAGARSFLEAHEVAEGETLCFTGVAGGYSILNVRVHGDEVAILTGSIPADGHASGHALIEGFVAERPWIGAQRSMGRRAIPLGRPHDELARGRVAAIGDAARQVFSAHGSGIGPGMVAARTLVDTLADGGSPEDWAARWMRERGGLFAAYDQFRRFSQSLTVEALTELMRAGLIDAETASAAMAQRFPRPGPRRALAMASALAKNGGVAGRLAAVGARAAALQALYAAYPRGGDRARWSAAVARAAGE